MPDARGRAARGTWWLKITKERVLFTLGAGGFVHEVTVGATERPMLLMACLVMMGLPAFLPDGFRVGSGSVAPTSPSEPGSSSRPGRSPTRPSSSARTGVTVALL